jgi:hypothetical protein
VRKELDRARALEKLYRAQLAKIDQELSDADRRAAAARAMDRLVGDEWRVEIKVPGVRFVGVDTAAAPGDSTEVDDECATDEFYGRVKRALGDVGTHPDSVEFEDGQPNPSARAARTLHRVKTQLQAFIKSLP